jgi:predicted signal transduction protein with EAL and GGDEF domain
MGLDPVCLEGEPHSGLDRLAIGGSLLLAAATGLSGFDAIDSFILRPDEPVVLASWLWLLLFDLPMPIFAILLVWSREEQQRLLSELRVSSVTDQLSGALNRRGFFERAATSIAQAKRADKPVSLVVFDIDRFKAINDAYGHLAGDRAIKSFAGATRWRRVRLADVRQRRSGCKRCRGTRLRGSAKPRSTSGRRGQKCHRQRWRR